MRRLLALLLAATSASPVLAQHSGHGHADHSQHGHQVHQGHQQQQQQPAQHSGQASPPAQPDPHAGHTVPPSPAQPAAGDAQPHHHTQQPDPHAGHGSAEPAPLPPQAPPPPEALSGPAHAADSIFGPADMARSRAELTRNHGGLFHSKLLIDQLEVRFGGGEEGHAWDAQAWVGGDINKLWLKSEGEGTFGHGVGGAEVQALWSRAVDPWFDVQLGVRQDLQPGPDRTHVVLGFQGLAPYWFEVEGALFVSDKGDVTARAEAEYDLRLTQALILQPRLEAEFSLQPVPELDLGSGLTTAELGARLRYELFPRSGLAVVAPYVGVEYERAFGGTARFRRIAGEDAGGWRLVVGLRTWL